MIKQIDPFIGVDGAGNCLPGPYLPLGLVRLSPDTLAPQPTNGYRSHRPICRFSHTHVSGTGGSGRFGNIGVTPFVGLPRLVVEPFEREAESAACGYYTVTSAATGITCELTATARVGVHRYRFPAGKEAHVLLDVGCVLQGHGGRVAHDDVNGWPPESVGGCVELVSERALAGRGDYRGGWGHGEPYSIYFYAEFDRPIHETRVGRAGGWHPHPGRAEGSHLAAVASFGFVRELGLRVGISFVSVAQARASVVREAAGVDFDTVRQRAEAAWEKVFARLRVTGGTNEQRTLFATLLTRLLCMPTDLGVDDEFPAWRSGGRHFSEYYCLWDSVRNANSLIALFDPELAVDMLNCLLDIGEHTGWVPDAWITGHSAFLQGGCSAAILAGEAAVKELPGFDAARALRQLRRDAEGESPDPYYFGRYLREYRELGYVAAGTPQSVSRHLEYAYQDWCLAEVAARAGDATAAEAFRHSSRKVWNLWRAEGQAFAPRRADGGWAEPFDPNYCRADAWNDPHFYEGSSRQWSWNVQHDFAGLVDRWGGAVGFAATLDQFFSPATERSVYRVGQPVRADRYASKETMLHVPYLYHYAGQPNRTAEVVRWAMQTFFQPTRSGLHDNEDMGCQSAFYIASALGIYPLMGQDVYWLTTPVFTRSEITLGAAGRVLVVEAPDAGPDRPYIVGATLNGQPLDRAWLRHGEIRDGATLRLELASEPTNWGANQPPPTPLGASR